MHTTRNAKKYCLIVAPERLAANCMTIFLLRIQFSVSVNNNSHGTIELDDGSLHSESIVRVQTPASDASAVAATESDSDNDDVVGDVTRYWVRDASSLHQSQRRHNSNFDDVIKM